MDWVAQLPRLEALNLNYTPVTDAGFSKLYNNTAFSELHLDRTDLSDKSLSWLTGQKNLEYLDLYHTLVSEPGFRALRKAQPKTEINWSLDAARTRRRT
jgi:hypothetical protein